MSDFLPQPADLGIEPEEIDPLTWLHLLEDKIKEQTEVAELYDEYYSNERELDIIKKDYEQVFGRNSLDPPKTNLAAVGVNAVAERLRVDGFRVGDEDAGEGAKAAHTIWMRNHLDVMFSISNVEMLIKSRTFMLIWPDKQGKAVITIEDPTQFAVERRPTPPYDVIAAAKIYTDTWGRELAILWLEDGMRKYEAAPGGGELWTPPNRSRAVRSRWREREPHFTKMPAAFGGRLPIEEFGNRQRLLKEPVSDLVDVAPLVDTHAKILADLIIACSFGAVPIRYATGIKLERNPDGTLKREPDGSVRPPFNIRADRAMVSEDKDAKFGMLEVADLAGYVSALDEVRTNVRIVTRVPQHYYGEGLSSGLTGETLKSSEASLVRRVNGMLDPLAMPLRSGIASALALETDLGEAPVSVRWADTETRIEAQLIDGGNKLRSMGVPLEWILIEHLKQDPAAVERAMDMAKKEAALGQEVLRRLNADVALAGEDDDATVPPVPSDAA